MSTWLPNAERIPGNDAGAMNGSGGRKLLLHSTEGPSIAGAVAAYRARNVWPTLTADLPHRQVAQHLPLEVAARSLLNLAGGVQTNKAGTVLVQIEMVGFATDPSSIGDPDDLAWFGREVVGPICRAMAIPLRSTVRWATYPGSYGEAAAQRLSPTAWVGYSGLLGHQHAPENSHGDPGAIDINRILAAAGGAHIQEEDVALTEPEFKRIAADNAKAAREAADAAALQAVQFLTRGQTNTLFDPKAQGNGWIEQPGTVTLPKLAAAVAGVDTDEAAIAAAVLATLTADAIAAAIPEAQADAVLDKLAARLAG